MHGKMVFMEANWQGIHAITLKKRTGIEQIVQDGGTAAGRHMKRDKLIPVSSVSDGCIAVIMKAWHMLYQTDAW